MFLNTHTLAQSKDIRNLPLLESHVYFTLPLLISLKNDGHPEPESNLCLEL